MGRQRQRAATELARVLLSGVARLNGRFGLKQVVRLLHGEARGNSSASASAVPTFGRLADRAHSDPSARCRYVSSAGSRSVAT